MLREYRAQNDIVIGWTLQTWNYALAQKKRKLCT